MPPAPRWTVPSCAPALEYARPGDTLIVWRLDRLSRSVRDLLDQAEQLRARGVDLRSLTEAIDTTTPGGQMVFTVLAAVAQLERDIIKDRTLAGLAEARRQGRLGGRPRVVTPQRAAIAHRLRAEGHTLDQVATQLRVSRASVVRMLTTPRTDAEGAA